MLGFRTLGSTAVPRCSVRCRERSALLSFDDHPRCLDASSRHPWLASQMCDCQWQAACCAWKDILTVLTTFVFRPATRNPRKLAVRVHTITESLERMQPVMLRSTRLARQHLARHRGPAAYRISRQTLVVQPRGPAKGDVMAYRRGGARRWIPTQVWPEGRTFDGIAVVESSS